MCSPNDTLPADGPAVQKRATPAARDRTPELTRIVRHALKAAAPTSVVDQAIRTAAGMTGSLPEAGEELDSTARLLAGQINALLGQQAAADPHRETVRN